MNGGYRWYHRWLDRLADRWPVSERRRSIAAGLAFGASAALLVLTALVVILVYDALESLEPFLYSVDGTVDPREVAVGLLKTSAVGIGVSLAAGLGAALSGAPLWWLFVEKPSEPTKRRGGLVGASVGILAHPMMWLVGGVVAGVGAGVVWLVFSGMGALADVVLKGLSNFGMILKAFVFFSGVGLLYTGIVTVPVATATGVALARVHRKVLETESEPSERRPQDL